MIDILLSSLIDGVWFLERKKQTIETMINAKNKTAQTTIKIIVTIDKDVEDEDDKGDD